MSKPLVIIPGVSRGADTARYACDVPLDVPIRETLVAPSLHEL